MVETYASDPMFSSIVGDPKTQNGAKAILAEGFGTFALVFIGCGTAALMSPDNATAMLIVAIAFALILMIIIYVWGPISGAHVNPAITMSMAIDGRISIGKMIGYWIAQFLGAIIAALLLLYIFGTESSLGSSIGYLTDTFPWKAVVIETIITIFLVYVVLVVTTKKELEKYAGFIIGFTLGVGVLFGYLLTGGSMNPARSLGPALVSNNLTNIWIYFIGPILGSLIAYMLYWTFNKKVPLMEPYSGALVVTPSPFGTVADTLIYKVD